MVGLAGRLGAAAMLIGAVGGAESLADEAFDATPHRAIYELRLDRASDRSHVLDVGGEMAVSWESYCDGWAIEQTYRLAFAYADGSNGELISNFASWEARSGGAFSFTGRTTLNGVTEEEVRGVAELEPQGGIAHYRLPAETEQQLPAGTYFPSGHTLALLDRARQGETAFSAMLFDGSRADGLTEVNAAIGVAIPAGLELAEVSAAVLDGRQSWPVQLAFFDPEQAGPEPDHEVGFRLYSGGIVDQLIIDYGDFALRGELAAIEPLSEPEGC